LALADMAGDGPDVRCRWKSGHASGPAECQQMTQLRHGLDQLLGSVACYFVRRSIAKC
jgi:hypothetical protein